MGISLWMTRPRCPECKSLEIREIFKKPQSMRGVDMSTGGGGGGHATTQTIFEVKYRCKACQAEWTSMKTETR